MSCFAGTTQPRPRRRGNLHPLGGQGDPGQGLHQHEQLPAVEGRLTLPHFAALLHPRRLQVGAIQNAGHRTAAILATLSLTMLFAKASGQMGPGALTPSRIWTALLNNSAGSA